MLENVHDQSLLERYIVEIFKIERHSTFITLLKKVCKNIVKTNLIDCQSEEIHVSQL